MKIETPRGKVLHNKNGTKAVLKWNPDFQPKWQGRFDAAQEFIDNEVLRLSSPYLPKQTGILEALGILGTIPGSGEVVWNGPYARYLYYHKLMIGHAPKQLTDIDLTFHGAPKRGGMWFERMKADKKNQILAGARRIAGGETK